MRKISSSNVTTQRSMPQMKKFISEYEYENLCCQIIEVAIISGVIDKYYEIQAEDLTNP